MINCIYCKVPGQILSDVELTREFSSQDKSNYNIKILECNCGNRWPVVDLHKELFDVTILGANLKTFNDFLNLSEVLSKNYNRLDLQHATLVKDCTSRINDWLTSGGKVEDMYVQNMLSKLESI